MQRSILYCLLLLCCACGRAQEEDSSTSAAQEVPADSVYQFTSGLRNYTHELRIYENGLIYNQRTMDQLQQIVDSLNLQFATCESTKTYYALPQATGHYIQLEEADLAQAISDIEKGIGFNAFLRKYPQAQVYKNALILKYKYTNRENKEVVQFGKLPFSHSPDHEVKFEDQPEVFYEKVKGRWKFQKYTDYRDKPRFLFGFYFTTEFESQPIPETYARMVQYAECLVDSSTQVLTKRAQMPDQSAGAKINSKVDAFLNYVHQETNRPVAPNDEVYNEAKSLRYWRQYQAWDSLRLQNIDQGISRTGKFNTLLRAAAHDALANGGSCHEFEEYTGRYYSASAELQLRRSRRVVGTCSQDRSPREHALRIAVLSAHTLNWPVFLRAHLDIMNDRFERVTDGSYAFEGRKTYIREIEELNIQVQHLLLGTALRIGNSRKNHYFSDLGRLGRALAESRHAQQIEEALLSMIKDHQLDDANRLLMFYLFSSYNSNLADTTVQRSNQIRLQKAVNTLPAYLSSQIDISTDDLE